MLGLVAAAFLAGCVIAFQPAMNAAFGRAAGGPFGAALNNFVVGVCAMLVAIALLRAWPDYPKASRDAPWWTWVGGLLGAGFVISSILLVPRLGAGVFITAMVTGQIVCSLVIDHFALVGMDRRPVTPAKIVGVSIMIVGLLVLRFGGGAGKAPGVSVEGDAVPHGNPVLHPASDDAAQPAVPGRDGVVVPEAAIDPADPSER
ncbi:MAG: DMT family transporter [Planctomycetota bacterium]